MARKSRHETQLAIINRSGVPQAINYQAAQPIRYNTAIYARLSVYDLGRSESDTMDNQINLLQDYVSTQSNLILAGVYADNGWTGTNFVRPEFMRMLEDVKRGKINCIVVKDFSRFGRNYIETGYFLQELFPLYQLRFIAVSDNYDSLTSDPESMAISMKNIVNDYYSKDISRKVSASLDMKRLEGVYSWGHLPYGYVRHPGNRVTWLMDTETAPYVHMIFQWAMDGVPIGRIARRLTELGAPTYQRLVNIRNNGKTRREGSKAWAASSVRFIITNQVYTGDFVYNKSYTRKYDPCNARKIPEDEWIVIPNAHQAYISHDDFFRIQDWLLERKNNYEQRKKHRDALRSAHPDQYQGLVFCGECQTRMRVRWDFNKSLYMAYSCPGRTNQHHQGHSHFSMNAKNLAEIITQELDHQIIRANDAQHFLAQSSIHNEIQRLKTCRRVKIQQLKTKCAQIKTARSEVYEDFVDEIIDTGTYQMQMEQLSSEQNSVNQQIQEAENQLEFIDKYLTLENPWIKTFAENESTKERTAELIRQRIRKIEIFPDKSVKILFSYAEYMIPLCDYIMDCRRRDNEYKKLG